MEIYYNFVYAVNHGLERDFAFKYAVSRADDIRYQKDDEDKRKSVQTMMRLTVDEGALHDMYRHIVIIDDMSAKVWNAHIPPQMVSHGVKFLCLCPEPFELDAYGPSVKLRGYEQIEVIRNKDGIFRGIMEILQSDQQSKYETTNRLKWLNLENEP